MHPFQQQTVHLPGFGEHLHYVCCRRHPVLDHFLFRARAELPKGRSFCLFLSRVDNCACNRHYYQRFCHRQNGWLHIQEHLALGIYHRIAGRCEFFHDSYHVELVHQPFTVLGRAMLRSTSASDNNRSDADQS